jgi:uncharacterized protein YjbI with pentapeptide repeats
MSDTILGVIIGGAFGFLGASIGILGNYILQHFKNRQVRISEIRKRLIGDRIQTSDIKFLIRSQRNRKKTISDKENMVDLSSSDFKGASLAGVDMRNVNLYRALMQQVILMKANLSYSNLHEANLEEAILVEAKMKGVNLFEANLTKTNMWRSNFSNSDMTKVKLINAHCPYANFEGVVLDRAVLKNANMFGVNFKNADLRYCDFSGACLQGAYLEGAGTTKHECNTIYLNKETILPDGSNWTEQDDFNRFTDKNHPSFWKPEHPFSLHVLEHEKREAVSEKLKRNIILASKLQVGDSPNH